MMQLFRDASNNTATSRGNESVPDFIHTQMQHPLMPMGARPAHDTAVCSIN